MLTVSAVAQYFIKWKVMVKVFAVALVLAILVGVAVVAGGVYVAVFSLVALAFNDTLGGKTLRCWVLLVASVVVTPFASVGAGYAVFHGIMSLT